MGRKTGRKTTCFQCSGRGNLPHYRHIDAGVCYRCRGSGSIEEEEDDHPASRSRAGSLRTLSAAEARTVAMRSLNDAASGFREIDSLLAEWNRHRRSSPLTLADVAERGDTEISRMVEKIGIALGHSVVDLKAFQLAADKARSRLPRVLHPELEAAIQVGVRRAADTYAGIEWRK